MKRTLILSALVASAMSLAAPALSAAADCPAGDSFSRIRCAEALRPLWNDLDTARNYRDRFRGVTTCSAPFVPWACCTGPGAGTCSPTSFTDLLSKYVSTTSGVSSQQAFRRLAGLLCPATGQTAALCGFRWFRDGKDPLLGADPAVVAEAQWGLQEALNELIAGELLLGNDLLIRGLRTRYPNASDPADPDQVTLLRQSGQIFDAAVAQVVGELRTNTAGLRVGDGDPGLPQPFYVTNARPDAGKAGALVESELFRITEIVDRAATANNSRGKRQFFFGNVTAAGRKEAARTMQLSAHRTYLHNAILSTVQSQREYSFNRGYLLKRQLQDAGAVYDDIAGGLNPLRLQGDFVPPRSKSISSYITDLTDPNSGSLARAISLENQLKVQQRTYDGDQTALREQLRTQRQTYFGGIERATGIVDVETKYNRLLTQQDREALLRDARAQIENPLSTGTQRSQFLAIEQAAVTAKLANEKVRQVPEKIRIEQDRQSAIAVIEFQGAVQRIALDVAIDLANAFDICTCGLGSGVKLKPGLLATYAIRAAKEFLGLAQSARIQGVNFDAYIKNQFLEQALYLIEVENAGIEIELRKAALAQSFAELERLVRGTVEAQEGIDTAYFSNPAYRLDVELTQSQADAQFQLAMVASYNLAQALEYQWAEDFENPIRRIGLPPIFVFDGNQTLDNAISRAESAFGAWSAGGLQPSLQDFLQALRLWDTKLRSARTPEGELNPPPVTISLRKQILGYAGGDEELNRLLFSDFIARHLKVPFGGTRPDLIVEFGLQLANTASDPNFFQLRPNVKITEMRGSIRALPGRHLRPVNAQSRAADLRMHMFDSATVRTYFAEPVAGRDELRTLKLPEGRSLETAPLSTTVAARVDLAPPDNAVPYSTGLRNLSPGVTRWVLWVRGDDPANNDLQLQFLDDIELTFRYRWGQPDAVFN